MTTNQGAAPAAYPDFTTVAATYAELAAVLAGFAFIGVMSLAISDVKSARRERATMRALPPMTAAFFGLVFVSLNYGVLVGEEPSTLRLANLSVFAGFGFTFAGMMLPYVLVVLLVYLARDAATEGRGRGNASKLLRESAGLGKLVICCVAPLLCALEYVAFRDCLTFIYGDLATNGPQRQDLISWALTGLLVVNSAVAAASSTKLAPRWLARAREFFTKDPDMFARWLSRMNVFASVAAILAIRVGLLWLRPDDGWNPDALTLATALFAVFAGVVTWSAMALDATPHFESSSPIDVSSPGPAEEELHVAPA